MEDRFGRVRRGLAENIRRLCTEAGLSQEALARTAGADRTYISQIERGIGNPSLRILCRLCDTLDIEVSDLLIT